MSILAIGLRSVAIVLTIAALPGAAGAQALLPEGDRYPLSLAEARRTALANNLELVWAGYAPVLAEQNVVIEDAQFDSAFVASLDHEESKEIPFSIFSPTKTSVDLLRAGFTNRLYSGFEYSLGFATASQDVSGLGTVRDTYYSSGLEFGFRLPLLNGLGTEVNTVQLILARADLDVSRLDLELQAEQTLLDVESAYWDVKAAQEAERVSRLSLSRAQDLLKLNRKKVEVGTLAPIEVTQAEAGVAAREEDVIRLGATVVDAEDQLRLLMGVPPGHALWDKGIDCVDQPRFAAESVSMEAAIEAAIANRSEVASAEQTVRDAELVERVAKKGTRHKLDLEVNIGPLGSSPRPELVDGSFEAEESPDWTDSVTRIFDGDEYSWRAGLVYGIPIGNRAAKANYARAQLIREQAEAELLGTRDVVRVEVRRAVRAVDSGAKRVEAARVNVELQKKKLDAEQKKFENGMSTSFEVLTFQNDLADAEVALIRAVLDYNKALSALEASKGTLLEARGFSLADLPETGRQTDVGLD